MDSAVNAAGLFQDCLCFHEIFQMGITSIRLDFSIENPEEVYNITKAYLDMMTYQEYDLELHDVTYGYYLDNENY